MVKVESIVPSLISIFRTQKLDCPSVQNCVIANEDRFRKAYLGKHKVDLETYKSFNQLQRELKLLNLAQNVGKSFLTKFSGFEPDPG